jgi:hypothetical protein
MTKPKTFAIPHKSYSTGGNASYKAPMYLKLNFKPDRRFKLNRENVKNRNDHNQHIISDELPREIPRSSIGKSS